jgi:hypothetical protein
VRASKTVFNVREFGAVGDGRTDDTASIQATINAAAGFRATVLFPPSIYIVTQLHLMAGVTLEGYGAILKRPDATPAKPLRKFAQMLTTSRNLWDSDQDSPPLVIRGLRIDGNRANQGAYTNYELQQAHLIFLHAATQKAGKLRALVEDVSLVENVADGLSVYTNCSVQVKNLYASECFRGGLVITGGYTDMQVTGYRERSTLHRYGINIEVDGPGFGSSYAIDVNMRDVDISGGFDVGISGGSHVRGSNIRSGPGFHLYAPGSRIWIQSSSFQIGEFSGTTDRVVYPQDVLFDDCDFTVTGTACTKGPRSFAAIHTYWQISGHKATNQTLRFKDCRWHAGPNIRAVDTLYAIHTEADEIALGNRILVERGNISRAYDYGVYITQGGRGSITGTKNAAAVPYAANGFGIYGVELQVDGVQLQGARP